MSIPFCYATRHQKRMKQMPLSQQVAIYKNVFKGANTYSTREGE